MLEMSIAEGGVWANSEHVESDGTRLATSAVGGTKRLSSLRSRPSNLLPVALLATKRATVWRAAPEGDGLAAGDVVKGPEAVCPGPKVSAHIGFRVGAFP
jgi:hypothetical protein